MIRVLLKTLARDPHSVISPRTISPAISARCWFGSASRPTTWTLPSWCEPPPPTATGRRQQKPATGWATWSSMRSTIFGHAQHPAGPAPKPIEARDSRRRGQERCWLRGPECVGIGLDVRRDPSAHAIPRHCPHTSDGLSLDARRAPGPGPTRGAASSRCRRATTRSAASSPRPSSGSSRKKGRSVLAALVRKLSSPAQVSNL